MELPLLPQIRPDPAKLKEFGAALLRDIPRAAASLTLAVKGEREFKPGEGLFPTVEKFLFGTEVIKRPEIAGKELLKSFGVGEEKAEELGGAVGFPLAALSLTPFGVGKKKVAKEVVENLVSKYGDDVAKQIVKIGGDDLAKKALIAGGDELVSKTLNLNRSALLIKKLNASLKAAAPAREEISAAVSAERSVRAAKAAQALEAIPGEAGAKAALSQLKGEIAKPTFEPIRQLFRQEEVDALNNVIREYPATIYTKITAIKGLAKIFDGLIPYESELRVLNSIFGRELTQNLVSKVRPAIVSDIVNVPRAIISSVDMSFPFRQGAILMVEKPKLGFAAFKDMFKYFFSEKAYQAFMDDIIKRPTYQLMDESGLFIADISGQAVSLTAKEEHFLSNFAEKIPILGRLIRASERAFVGMGNKIRADVFDDIAAEYIRGGIDPTANPDVFKRLAAFINTATGRGSLGPLNRAAPLLNGVFFSPRFMMSRVQMLNPAFYMSLDPATRKIAARAMVKFVGTGIGILSLAKLGGALVEDNLLSSDFGKIRIGNIRWDIWGGFQQWVRFTAQMIMGEYKSTSTGEVRLLSRDKFPFLDRLDWAFKFFQGKLAPAPAFVADLLRGQTLLGEELRISEEAMDRLVPIYIQDIVDAVKESGVGAAAGVAVPAFFGVGTQAFSPREKKVEEGMLPRLPALPALPSLPRL